MYALEKYFYFNYILKLVSLISNLQYLTYDMSTLVIDIKSRIRVRKLILSNSNLLNLAWCFQRFFYSKIGRILYQIRNKTGAIYKFFTNFMWFGIYRSNHVDLNFFEKNLKLKTHHSMIHLMFMLDDILIAR